MWNSSKDLLQLNATIKLSSFIDETDLARVLTI